jgi:hypothetical protein
MTGMAIFGRSKKKTTIIPQPHFTPIYGSQPDLQGPYAIAPQPGSTNFEQRPNTSHGHGLPPPQNWAGPLVPYQPVFVSQNYILPPPLPQRPPEKGGAIRKLKLKSVSNLLAGDVPHCVPGAHIFNDGIPAWQHQATQYLCQGAALYDLISSKFDTVVTLIDGERFSGDERELVVFQQPAPMFQEQQQQSGYTNQELIQGKSKGVINSSISSTLISTNYFTKVNLYANSRLPPNLPPMKL